MFSRFGIINGGEFATREVGTTVRETPPGVHGEPATLP